MWYLFFIVGSWWFFALCGLAVIALFVAVESDSPSWATLTLIGYFAALALFGDFNVMIWLGAHPWKALTYIGSFFVIGAAWSVAKWWFFVRARLDKYREYKLKFIKKHNLDIKVKDPIPESFLPAYNGWFDWRIHPSAESCVKRPSPGSHKSRIMMWMMYWPWSMLWTLINDPIKKLFKIIYARIVGVFESISDRMYGDVEAEMKLAEDARSDRMYGDVEAEMKLAEDARKEAIKTKTKQIV